MATLQTRISDLAGRIATECKDLRTLINGNAVDLSALTTTHTGSLVAAINELKGLVDVASAAALAAAQIDDTAPITSTNKAWSAHRISVEIQAAKDALVGGAASALDTLAELAAALGNDANFASTVTTALANRVRVDAAQTLTVAQQLQARSNIGAQDAASIGNPDTDFVAVFNAGLI